MTIVNQNLYSFDEVKDMFGMESSELFRFSLLQAYRPITQGNRLYYTKEQVRNLALRGER